ncbi:hypothetical protein MMC13_004139 [Lambiella insularis]|nr:hypothetical protein [Lambiella insularis]
MATSTPSISTSTFIPTQDRDVSQDTQDGGVSLPLDQDAVAVNTSTIEVETDIISGSAVCHVHEETPNHDENPASNSRSFVDDVVATGSEEPFLHTFSSPMDQTSRAQGVSPHAFLEAQDQVDMDMFLDMDTGSFSPKWITGNPDVWKTSHSPASSFSKAPETTSNTESQVDRATLHSVYSPINRITNHQEQSTIQERASQSAGSYIQRIANNREQSFIDESGSYDKMLHVIENSDYTEDSHMDERNKEIEYSANARSMESAQRMEGTPPTPQGQWQFPFAPDSVRRVQPTRSNTLAGLRDMPNIRAHSQAVERPALASPRRRVPHVRNNATAGLGNIPIIWPQSQTIQRPAPVSPRRRVPHVRNNATAGLGNIPIIRAQSQTVQRPAPASPRRLVPHERNNARSGLGNIPIIRAQSQTVEQPVRQRPSSLPTVIESEEVVSQTPELPVIMVTAPEDIETGIVFDPAFALLEQPFLQRPSGLPTVVENEEVISRNPEVPTIMVTAPEDGETTIEPLSRIQHSTYEIENSFLTRELRSSFPLALPSQIPVASTQPRQTAPEGSLLAPANAAPGQDSEDTRLSSPTRPSRSEKPNVMDSPNVLHLRRAMLPADDPPFHQVIFKTTYVPANPGYNGHPDRGMQQTLEPLGTQRYYFENNTQHRWQGNLRDAPGPLHYIAKGPTGVNSQYVPIDMLPGAGTVMQPASAGASSNLASGLDHAVGQPNLGFERIANHQYGSGWSHSRHLSYEQSVVPQIPEHEPLLRAQMQSSHYAAQQHSGAMQTQRTPTHYPSTSVGPFTPSRPVLPELPYRPATDTMFPAKHGDGPSLRWQAFAFKGQPDLDRVMRPAFLPFYDATTSRAPSTWGVIQITNIPYTITKKEIHAFLGTSAKIIPESVGEAIHIIMDRGNGKTMDAFVEFISHADAMVQVEKHLRGNVVGGRSVKLGQRHVNVRISNQETLMKALFPRAKNVKWQRQQPMIMESTEPFNSGFKGFITNEELVSMVRFAEQPQRSGYNTKCQSRTYEAMISVLHKFPWFATAFYTIGQRDAVHTHVVKQIRALVIALRHSHPPDLTPTLLKELMYAGLNVPAFPEAHKWAICFAAEWASADVCISPYAQSWPFLALSRKPGWEEDVVEWYVELINLAALCTKGVTQQLQPSFPRFQPDVFRVLPTHTMEFAVKLEMHVLTAILHEIVDVRRYLWNCN